MKVRGFVLLSIVLLIGTATLAEEQLDVSPAPAETAGPQAPYVGRVNAERVNVRAGDGTNYTILTVAQGGDLVVVVGEKFGWLRIQLPPAVRPWISADYVQELPGGRAGTVTGDNVRIRSNPSTASDVLGMIGKGRRVEIVAAKEGWYQIAGPPEASAWISGKYVDYYGTVEEHADELAKERVFVEVRAGVEAKIAEADKLYREELKKPLTDRDFSAVVAIYEEIADEADQAFVREAVTRRVEALNLVQSLIEDYKRIRADNEELSDKLREMEIRMHEAEKAAETPPRPSYLAEGWVQPMGRIINSPATHKIVVGGKTICLLRSSTVDLNGYLFKRVGVNGSKHSAPGWDEPVIDVTEIELLGAEKGKAIPAKG